MSVGLRCKPLLDKAGSCQRAVAHVHDHFAARFASPGASLVSFSDLPDVEPEFTEGEVLQAVGQLKTGKTTGMSKVSVELLRALVSVSFGLYVLTSLLNSLLRFQLFDSVWWCRQQRAGVEKSLLIYQARDLSLWALWFIDDAILMFRNLSQLSRLLPEVFQLFADMGLAVNLKVLPLIPCALPPCLAGYSVRSWATYLGQTIKLIEGDAHMVSSLCRRATSAFFANRPLRFRTGLLPAVAWNC